MKIYEIVKYPASNKKERHCVAFYKSRYDAEHAIIVHRVMSRSPSFNSKPDMVYEIVEKEVVEI